MGSVLELLVVLLAAFGLVCLAWLVFGKLVLPVGQEGTRTVAQVTAQGSGSGLEHTVSGLLWLRRSGLVARDGGDPRPRPESGRAGGGDGFGRTGWGGAGPLWSSEALKEDYERKRDRNHGRVDPKQPH